jgi:hypothetical protein
MKPSSARILASATFVLELGITARRFLEFDELRTRVRKSAIGSVIITNASS